MLYEKFKVKDSESLRSINSYSSNKKKDNIDSSIFENRRDSLLEETISFINSIMVNQNSIKYYKIGFKTLKV
jgi:hypothetical protein